MDNSIFALHDGRQGGFAPIRAGRFRKDVIRVGRWRLPDGRTLNLTRERLRKWVDTFHAMRRAGHRISVPLDHSRRSEDNLGFVEDVRAEGDTLYAVLDIASPEHQSKIGTTLREVSIGVDPELRDSTGKVWEDFISHVAVCTNPVITGQGDFERIAARSETEKNIIFCRREESNMGFLDQVRDLVGAEKDADESAVLETLKTGLGDKDKHTETLRRAKRERDNALEASRKSKEKAEALELRVKKLEEDKGGDEPEESEREIELRRRVEAMEDKAAQAEVAEAIRCGKLLDKVKDDAFKLLRGEGIRLSRQGEDDTNVQEAFRNVLESLPQHASLDMEERARRGIELRNPNNDGGEKLTDEQKRAEGKRRAEAVQGKRD